MQTGQEVTARAMTNEEQVLSQAEALAGLLTANPMLVTMTEQLLFIEISVSSSPTNGCGFTVSDFSINRKNNG